MYRSKAVLLSFMTAVWSQTGQKKQSDRKRVEKVNKSCIWWTNDKTILLECSVWVMLNYQLEIVEEEFVTSIGHLDEFYVNLFFDRSIYRSMCTHMGYIRIYVRPNLGNFGEIPIFSHGQNFTLPRMVNHINVKMNFGLNCLKIILMFII